MNAEWGGNSFSPLQPLITWLPCGNVPFSHEGTEAAPSIPFNTPLPLPPLVALACLSSLPLPPLLVVPSSLSSSSSARITYTSASTWLRFILHSPVFVCLVDVCLCLVDLFINCDVFTGWCFDGGKICLRLLGVCLRSSSIQDRRFIRFHAVLVYLHAGHLFFHVRSLCVTPWGRILHPWALSRRGYWLTRMRFTYACV